MQKIEYWYQKVMNYTDTYTKTSEANVRVLGCVLDVETWKILLLGLISAIYGGMAIERTPPSDFEH